MDKNLLSPNVLWLFLYAWLLWDLKYKKQWFLTMLFVSHMLLQVLSSILSTKFTMPFHWVCLKLHMLRRHCVPHWQCHPTNCSYASTAAAFASARFYRVLIFRGCDDIHVCVRPCEVIDDGCAGCNLNKCRCGVWRPSRECRIHRVFFI